MDRLADEVRNIIRDEIRVHPEIYRLMSDITDLRERLDKMERCCVCVKINAPLEIS